MTDPKASPRPDDLVERLIETAAEVLDPGYPYYGVPDLVREAAAEITRLRDENARLEKEWSAMNRSIGDLVRQRERAEAERDAMNAALEWYGSRAADIARYLSMKPPQITAFEAVMTELTLDAGKRAIDAARAQVREVTPQEHDVLNKALRNSTQEKP